MDGGRLRSSFETVAFTTPVPFDAEDEVDHEALADNLSGLYDAGARLFVPCGNTGEYYALTDEERVAVVETHAEATGDEATIAAGASGNEREVLALAERYREAGADAVMVMHPDHTYVHERGLVSYYEAICDGTDLGVVVYKRGPEITRDVLVELSELDEVVAVKFAVDDVREFAQTVEDAEGSVTWINGIAERYAIPFAIEGASGYTTGVGNFVPRVTLALFEAIEKGQWDRARRIQRALRPLEDLRDEPGEGSSVPNGNNVPVVKHGLDIAGYTGGSVRRPLVDLGAADRERLESYYERLETWTPSRSPDLSD
ncbi:dihydrodipicolinate synthase family protein [Halosimplex aquaticum]|uniref:Dihydrodipicolinate synthase family protein n=1 Tax=Halosimplex aquaticum TaxID=3026162 RepID=A0ABD5Y4R9_9EURY|nr:dihydrodipicolinate synthase family protein [Halosimplex aquaticum]